MYYLLRKAVILAATFLFLVTLPAYTQDDWRALIGGDRDVGYKVEGATSVDTKAAQALHAEGALFFDARNLWSWKLGHIPGAIKFDYEDLEVLAEPDDTIVFYCDGSHCKKSANASAYAVTQGYTNIYLFAAGFPGWKMAGLPLEVSE